MRRVARAAVGLITIIFLMSGCGRLRTPGQKPFEGKIARTSTMQPSSSPVPEQTGFEAGPKEAKVRIVAYYPIDDARKSLVELLRSLPEQYPGKVYVKCTDIRTPEGREGRQRSGGSSPGLMINAQSGIVIDAKPEPYRVEFNQDMGRFWTAEDLKAAVAQEVARVYGK